MFEMLTLFLWPSCWYLAMLHSVPWMFFLGHIPVGYSLDEAGGWQEGTNFFFHLFSLPWL